MNDLTRAERLIAEYKRLRKQDIELMEKWNEIDERMKKIESELPDDYIFPGDAREEYPRSD